MSLARTVSRIFARFHTTAGMTAPWKATQIVWWSAPDGVVKDCVGFGHGHSFRCGRRRQVSLARTVSRIFAGLSHDGGRDRPWKAV
jgi:hypothetical protein